MGSLKTYTVAVLEGGTYDYRGEGAGLATTVRATSRDRAVIAAARKLGVRNGRFAPRRAEPSDPQKLGDSYRVLHRILGYTASRTHLFGFATALVVEGVAFDHGTPAQVVIDYAIETFTG